MSSNDAYEAHRREQLERYGPHIQPLRDMLVEVVDAAWETADRRQWMPKPGSPAYHDLRDPKWGKPTSSDPSPVQFGHLAAQVQLSAATDHMQALERLITPPPSVYGAVAVTRAAVEAHARAAWLLDSQCNRRTRVARYLTEHMQELRWQARLPLDYLKVGAEPALAQLADEVIRCGFAPTHDGAGRLSKVEIDPPKAGDLVSDLAREGGRDVIRSVYNIYSNTVHAGFATLRRSLKVAPDTDDPRIGVATRTLTAKDVHLMVGDGADSAGSAEPAGRPVWLDKFGVAALAFINDPSRYAGTPRSVRSALRLPKTRWHCASGRATSLLITSRTNHAARDIGRQDRRRRLSILADAELSALS